MVENLQTRHGKDMRPIIVGVLVKEECGFSYAL